MERYIRQQPFAAIASMKAIPAFMDETGVLTQSAKEQPVYGIGLLLVEDPGRVTDSLYGLHFRYGSDRAAKRSQVRQQVKLRGDSLTLEEFDRLMWSTRHYEYKYSDISQHNLQQYIDLLNLCFSSNCMEFHALLVDRTEEGFSLAEWGYDPWRAYAQLGRELLEQSLTRPAFATVDFQGQPRNSSLKVEDAFCSAKQVAGCIRAASESQVFLQVVDLLLGCVQADWKNRNGFYVFDSSRGRAKREALNFLRTRLALPASQPMVARQNRVFKAGGPLPFTVSLRQAPAAMTGALPD